VTLDTAAATVVAAAIGAVAGGSITVLNMWLARRSEERRQIRELAVRAAIENWKHFNELAQRHGGEINPLDLYLVHAMHLVTALDGRLSSEKKVSEHLRKTFAITKAAQKEILQYNRQMDEAARSEK